MDDEQGEDGDALLFVDMAEDAGDGLFAFLVREQGYERVRGG